MKILNFIKISGKEMELNFIWIIINSENIFSSILGYYIGIFLIASRIFRRTLVADSYHAIYTELPNVDRILQLCYDIYLVRENHEFTLEEDLYAKLIFLVRSPELLIWYTRLEMPLDGLRHIKFTDNLPDQDDNVTRRLRNKISNIRRAVSYLPPPPGTQSESPSPTTSPLPKTSIIKTRPVQSQSQPTSAEPQSQPPSDETQSQQPSEQRPSEIPSQLPPESPSQEPQIPPAASSEEFPPPSPPPPPPPPPTPPYPPPPGPTH